MNWIRAELLNTKVYVYQKSEVESFWLTFVKCIALPNQIGIKLTLNFDSISMVSMGVINSKNIFLQSLKLLWQIVLGLFFAQCVGGRHTDWNTNMCKAMSVPLLLWREHKMFVRHKVGYEINIWTDIPFWQRCRKTLNFIGIVIRWQGKHIDVKDK